MTPCPFTVKRRIPCNLDRGHAAHHDFTELEAVTPDTTSEAVQRLMDRCNELDKRPRAWRFLSTDDIRRELGQLMAERRAS